VTSNRSDAPLLLRVRMRAGPEMIGSILAAGVIVVVAGAVLLPRPSGISAGTTLPASASPSDRTTPSAIVTPRPNPAAPTLVVIADRLLAQRADLEAERSRKDASVQVIAQLLRDINASLVLQDAPLALLAADPATADLAARIQATHDATFEAVGRAQQASIRNLKAYRDGAAEVVALLEPLVALRAELAALANDHASPALTGQPVGSPAPGGSTR
jgi:hypothetical protein